MRSARIALAVLFLLAGLTLPGLAAPNLTIRGGKMSPAHAKIVRRDLRTLRQAGVPAYLALSNVSGKPAEHVWTQGDRLATVVAGVNAGNVGNWMEHIGQHSIGLVMGYTNHWSGHIRVGERFYHHKQARGTIDTNKGIPKVEADTAYRAQARAPGSFLDQVIRPSGKWGTRRDAEVTVLGSKGEIDAVQAFYAARFHRLIRANDARAIMPKLKFSGGCTVPTDLMGVKAKAGQPNIVAGFGTESCAGTATAFANEAWQKAFGANIDAIRAYGQEQGIAELSNVTAETVTHLRSIASRINGQQDFAKYLAFANYGRPGNMMTFFNTEPEAATPHTSETLAAGRTWSRARKKGSSTAMSWTKMLVGAKGDKRAQPDHIIPDRAPGTAAPKQFDYVQTERIALETALAVLDAALE